MLGVEVDRSHDDWLEHSYFADRITQLCKIILIEDLARLPRIRDDVIDRNVSEGRTRDGQKILRCFT